ncbi:Xylitol dehydrogenase A [Hyphodiscus hymeniophilus]|uniref:Xylitol dehydrogenase A n=1 Tax=Hyphodiscus hymeniophilus TaxID=353542 RepID=A0A9P7AZ26_9HELO|nr:Xylitol dehydrogenase A [Hyphodiscus hymeniophilus]
MTTETPITQNRVKPSSEVKASVLHGVKELKIETRPLPLPSPSEVQVAVQATGLCGSDLHYYNHYRNGDIIVQEPLTLGHESSGIVTAVGSEVTNLKVGDRVALEVGLPCLECLGAILEPLGVAIHGSRRAALKPGSTVLIFGAGAVGLLCAAMSKYSGAKTVVIADIQADRVDFAVQNQFADAKIVVPMKRYTEIQEKLAFAKEVAEMAKSVSGVGEVDAVFECTGVESCLQAAIYSTRPGGKIMLIGMGSPIQTLPISAAALREVDLVGVFRYANTYEEAIKIVSSGSPLLPDLTKLITQRYTGLDDIPMAFAMAGRVKDDEGKLVLKVVVET